MALSRRTKLFLWAIVTACAVCAGWFAYSFCHAFSRFASEERICGAFHPVIGAIDQFQAKEGVLPTNLSQLVPAYLQQIPAAPVADTIDYRAMPDGTNWELTVRSHIAGVPRLLVQRSSGVFTQEERQQSLKSFHGWIVFRDTR